MLPCGATPEALTHGVQPEVCGCAPPSRKKQVPSPAARNRPARAPLRVRRPCPAGRVAAAAAVGCLQARRQTPSRSRTRICCATKECGSRCAPGRGARGCVYGQKSTVGNGWRPRKAGTRQGCYDDDADHSAGVSHQSWLPHTRPDAAPDRSPTCQREQLHGGLGHVYGHGRARGLHVVRHIHDVTCSTAAVRHVRRGTIECTARSGLGARTRWCALLDGPPGPGAGVLGPDGGAAHTPHARACWHAYAWHHSSARKAFLQPAAG